MQCFLFKALRNILVKLYISSMETFAKCDYIQHLINLTFNGFNRRATQMRLIANCSALYDFCAKNVPHCKINISKPKCTLILRNFSYIICIYHGETKISIYIFEGIPLLSQKNIWITYIAIMYLTYTRAEIYRKSIPRFNGTLIIIMYI